MESSNRWSRRHFLRIAGTTVTGALVLAACASADDLPASRPDAGRAPDGEKITLRVGHHWEVAFRPTQEAFDKKYQERHPDVAFAITYNTWSDHNTIVPTWAAANTLPDIIYVHGSRSFPWAFAGIIVSIQDQHD